jgi:hypothetical protein
MTGIEARCDENLPNGTVSATPNREVKANRALQRTALALPLSWGVTRDKRRRDFRFSEPFVLALVTSRSDLVKGQRRGCQAHSSTAVRSTPNGLAVGRANTMAPFTTIVSTNTRHIQWRQGHAASSQSARKT